MSPAGLHAQDVSKRLGRREVLRGVELLLEAGEITALLGANGAGKTTLLRILAGLALPSAGQVSVEGAADRRGARRAVGYVGHETMLYGALSAEENLRFAARLYGADPARARPLLDAAELGAVADQRVDSFSRGMRQRLALARAQVHDPPVLLLDEPFNALDARSASALETTLVSLRDTGTAICLVSHDLDRAARLADRAVLLHRGRCAPVPGPFDRASLERAVEAAP